MSYDRAWYSKDYVQKEIYGVRDSVNRGYMYWNGLCRYDDLSPDVGDSKYPWPSFEADSKFRKPALSGGSKSAEYPLSVNPQTKGDSENYDGDNEFEAVSPSSDTTAWDSIREQEKREKSSGFPSLGDIKKLWAAYDS